MTLRANLSSSASFLDYPFSLNLYTCDASKIVVPAQTKFYRYKLGDQQLVIPILRFQFNDECPEFEISYSATLTNGNLATASGITYLDEGVVFTVLASNISQIGQFDYAIKGYATVEGLLLESSMSLRILIVAAEGNSNSPPYFEYAP